VAEEKAPTLRRALFWALTVLVLDAFVLNQGAIAFLVGVWLIFISLPRAFFVKRWAGTRAARVRNIGIIMAAVILVFVANTMNNKLARQRAEEVVAAIEAFRAKENRYPANLQELVPGYLPSVPLAKYTLMFNEFRYLPSVTDPSLMYIALPPFGRPTYRFKERRWGYLD
jgi:hypothetical protein